MRHSKNAGLLYGVKPPSTNLNIFVGSLGSHSRTSGAKKTGAAVLARTSCQSGMLRLLSAREGTLYFARGLLLIGQGESVVTFRATTSSRHLRFSGSRFVCTPNLFFSSSARGSDL